MTENSRIYLDHNATTPLSEESKAAIVRHLSDWGNPSSIHMDGRGPKQVLREARQALAQGLGIHPLEIVFTSGGSESNNTVVQMLYWLKIRDRSERNEWITSTVEHPSVLKAFHWLEEMGETVHYIGVNRKGEIDRAAFTAALSDKTLLVSIMMANNETGTVFPIRELCAEAQARGALFHTDAVQVLGKMAVNLRDIGVDYASMSAHKFYALKGTGVLYYRKGVPWAPLLHGGGQERHRRAGTENVIGAAALGAMALRLAEVPVQYERLKKLRDTFESKLLALIPGTSITAVDSKRLPTTSHVLIAGVDGESLLMNLDIQGYSVSTGAACSSGNPEPSPVLLAMGLSRQEAQSSLRVSFGWGSTDEEVERFLQTLDAVVHRLRNLVVRPLPKPKEVSL